MSRSVDWAKVEAVRAKHLIPELTVNHTTQAPLFVIGQARSGTTILGNLIRKYLKVNFGPESQFFFRLAKGLDRYGDLHEDSNFRRLVSDMADERCFLLNQFGFLIDIDQVVRDAERTYAGAISAIYEQFAAHNGMTRWGDKTPDYIEHLDGLDQLFPDAQFVHIVRDGRDVALSNMGVFFGAKNIVVAAKEWVRLAQQTQRFFAGLPKHRYIEIRYEDFMQRPTEVFDQLIEFLRIDDPHDELRRFVHDKMPQELDSGNFNKWKTDLTEKQQLDYERVAHKYLKQQSYELQYVSHRPLNPVYEWICYLDHWFKKYSQPDAWRDNWYKLRLRLVSKIS